VGAIACAGVLGIAAVAAAGGAQAGQTGEHAAAARCPSGATSLPPNAVATAADAALRAAPRVFKGVDTRGARVLRSALGGAAAERGQQVKDECGASTQARTVVVDLQFPKMLPSASLSQGTVFVARVKGRYRVWEVAH
jgi:hypothetical protein